MEYLIFHQTIAFLVKIILGLLFVISGIVKLPDLNGFFIIVVQYGVLKGKLAKAFAYSFPFVEIIVGLMLLIGYIPLLFSGLVLILLLISTSGVIYAMYQKKKMDNCGCYGVAMKVPIGPKKILENSIWIILAVYLLVSNIIM